jgi:hypothetical protein
VAIPEPEATVIARLLLVAAVLLPALAAAQDPGPPPGSPPPAPPTQAAPAAPPGAPPAAPAQAAPAAPPAAVAPVAEAKPPAKEYSSYAILKAGWFAPTTDIQGSSFSSSGTWELAVGTGRIFGVELGVGSMSTSASGVMFANATPSELEVTTVPVLLSMRVQVPVAFVAPFVDLGGGAFFNKVSWGGASYSDATFGWQAGLGCDFHLGRLLVGAEWRFMAVTPAILGLGTITLDRQELMLRGGYRF